MAIEQLVKKGEKCIADKDYLGAISAFSSAIGENPKAFLPHLHRAVAYQKLNNLEDAKKDISVAFTIAEDRGNRSEIALCYFRLALVYYLEKKRKLALQHFNKAKELGCKEPTLDMWKDKCEYDLKKNPETDDDQDDLLENSLQSTLQISKPDEGKTPDAKSTSIDVINQQAPLKIKIRDDWYQTSDTVIITIYAKNVDKEKFNIQFQPRSVNLSFPSTSASEYSYNLDPLHSEIDPQQSHYKVYGTKIEVTLVKKEIGKWPSLESSKQTATNDEALSYPTSSKKAINWANFEVDEDEKTDQDENDFFSKLYKDVDDDTKRAMMKSYVQSNGTVLTTDWKEALKKEFETSPPEGMQARQW